MEGWKFKNGSGKAPLGVIASEAVREPGVPPGRTLGKLLEDNKNVFGAHFIFVTWGTYLDTIRLPVEKRAATREAERLEGDDSKDGWHPRWDWLEKYHGFALRPGKLGGIVEMAELLEESAPLQDRIRTLVFLTDPNDLEEAYPEDRALIRSAIRNNATLLTTYRSAALWAAFESEEDEGLGEEGGRDTMPSIPEEDTLALIAHNGRKLDMCRWVVEHREKIRRFRRIITTGTAGEWIGGYLEAVGVRKEKIEVIDKMASGPRGGDLQIAGAVLRKCCHHVIFFVDPMTSHPHEADIQTVLRTCTMPGVDVNLRITEQAATSWIATA